MSITKITDNIYTSLFYKIKNYNTGRVLNDYASRTPSEVDATFSYDDGSNASHRSFTLVPSIFTEYYKIKNYDTGRVLNDYASRTPSEVDATFSYDDGSNASHRSFTLVPSIFTEYYKIKNYDTGRVLNDYASRTPSGVDATFAYDDGEHLDDRSFKFIFSDVTGGYKVETEIIKFDYEQPDIDKLPKTQHSFGTIQEVNNCGQTTTLKQTVSFTHQQTVTNTMSFAESMTVGVDITTKITEKVGFPLVESTTVEDDFSFKWSSTSTATKTTATAKADTISISQEVTAGPNQCGHYAGTYDVIDKNGWSIPFTSQIKVTATGLVQKDDGSIDDNYQIDNPDAILSILSDLGGGYTVKTLSPLSSTEALLEVSGTMSAEWGVNAIVAPIGTCKCPEIDVVEFVNSTIEEAVI